MSYQVLGLAGQQGAGKDFTFERLQRLYGDKRRVRRMAFADGVRREVAREVFTALGIQIDRDEGMAHWQRPYTAGQRWLLQQWGTEYRRAQDADYWVKYGMDYIEQHANDGDLWVVTDVRFRNEAHAIEGWEFQRYGGRTALIQATAEERADRIGVTPEELARRSQHASEQIDFDTNFTITNHADVLLEPYLLRWLGLPPKCLRCAFCESHVWHDQGEAFSG